MVFAGIYPVETDDYPLLKDALEKLQLNDASLIYEPETSQALNFGFRCGFLGLFHMEIIQERIEREYDLDIIATAPSVEYEVLMATGEVITIDSPAQLPDPAGIEEIREPWMKVQIFTPAEYIGTVMDLVIKRRGEQTGHGVSRSAARDDHLCAAAVGIDRRLSRSPEEPHARLRLDGLFLPRLSRRRPGEDGHSGE